ncbi:hypothetical protein GCM10011579_068210 [Streptomyces albiflavescens]|uniref:Mutator family transposase n=1 Tax=Streptomyces albiflavescens TaxID=1623582 RepID=A0A918D7V8_9ACTN|nr:hypothetical protein GCM10011579_068210 [Streptomyces albiflavescens]
MALSQSELMRLLESLRRADGVEAIRVVCERILQELIEAEVTEVIGAAPREHSDQRATWRNGHRERLLTTQAGDLDLKIPKVRTGSFFPSLLERRRRIDRALFAVVMEAYVHGVETLNAGKAIWHKWCKYDAARARQTTAAAAVPAPRRTEQPYATGSAIVVEHDAARLDCDGRLYRLTMRRLLRNTGDAPITRYLIRISVDPYPGDPER